LRKTCSNKHSPTNTRIITYSDLHLEFGSGWMLPPAVNGDVMILAGDIVTLRDYDPLDQLLQKWKKPVLYVTGNHRSRTCSQVPDSFIDGVPPASRGDLCRGIHKSLKFRIHNFPVRL